MRAPRILSGLSGRLLVGHVLVIAVGMSVLLLGAQWAAPRFFERHMEQMHGLGMGPMRQGGMANEMAASIQQAFQQSVLEALLLSGLAALATAVMVSVLLARRMAGPIQGLAAASQRLASGKYSERVAVTGDDELARLASSFNEMADALEHVERRRTELIGDIAHELRTPIASVQGYLEGLLDGVVEPTDRTFAKLSDETGRLRRLVDDLQELSRAEAHQIPLTLQSLSPGVIAQTTVDRLASGFSEKGLDLFVSVPQGTPPVHADMDRAVQVLTNLLTNALRYTPAPGRVELSVAPVMQGIAFVVSDSGVGISPEDLPHVFERFYRSDKSRSRASGGSGVGLTIARALAESMGGWITAESPSTLGGSRFTFVLPQAS